MVGKIDIEQTELTPLICLDYENSIKQIKGICLPENAVEFFEPVLNWLDEYAQKPDKKAIFEFELDYFNTSSSKMLFEMMKQIKKIPNHKIVWTIYSDDEDMNEVVTDYKEMMGNLIEINEIERNYN